MPKATVETRVSMPPCVQSAWMRERLAESLPAWYESTSRSAQLRAVTGMSVTKGDCSHVRLPSLKLQATHAATETARMLVA